MQTPEGVSSQPSDRQADNPSAEPNASMQEYYQLQQELLVTTLVLAGIIFITVCFFYPTNIALNYLLGACTGVVYLKVLARNVAQLGNGKSQVGKSQVAIFVGLIIVATQWDQLQVLPIFLGFLTYKAALLVYTFRLLLPSDSR
ncbi:MAG: ATP synthase subunit I [Tildeniella nuda ZEHNDER 1965/U140]|jgi:ATP synthase protein I|nr:ATP synthase subunit I [Tildeniella nuda ZEHNDER 1965/U140]